MSTEAKKVLAHLVEMRERHVGRVALLRKATRSVQEVVIESAADSASVLAWLLYREILTDLTPLSDEHRASCDRLVALHEAEIDNLQDLLKLKDTRPEVGQ